MNIRQLESMAGNVNANAIGGNNLLAGVSPEEKKINSYPWFDWLRFVLASIVVLGHAGFRFAPFLNEGLAVSVFFALSGWLIGGILLNTEASELPRFYFNRSTRIWIPYLVAIVLLYGIAMLREGVDFFWLKYLVMDVTFTHQLFTFFPTASYEMPLNGSGNQFWSIAVEEQFYLLAPILMTFVLRGKTLGVWFAISILCVLMESNFGSISLGVCAAVLQRDYKISDQIGCRLVVLVLLLMSGYVLSMNTDDLKTFAEPIFSVAIVVFLATPGKRSKVSLFLGGLSYPLYLNHWIGLAFVHGAAKHLGFSDFVLLPAISFFFAVGVSIPLYLAIDRQISMRRDGWFTPRLGRNLGLIAYSLVVFGVIAGVLMYHYGPHGVDPLAAI